MLAFAQIRLNLTPGDFFKLSPPGFAAYRREWERQTREERIQFGLLRRDLINSGFCRPEKAVELNDLVPDWREAAGKLRQSVGSRRRLNKKTREEIANSLRRMLAGEKLE